MSPNILICLSFYVKCWSYETQYSLTVESLSPSVCFSLVDLFPEWTVAWYSVGCYYYSIGRQDPARRYLEKATKQEPMFGPAWWVLIGQYWPNTDFWLVERLVYGHSFAVENEHDQAMAAYYKALQVMPGCHLPQLYIGLENSLTNNTAQARTFFKQALL